jgi:hypothetical protein
MFGFKTNFLKKPGFYSFMHRRPGGKRSAMALASRRAVCKTGKHCAHARSQGICARLLLTFCRK